MRNKPLFHSLSPNHREDALKKFEQCVMSAKGTQYKQQFAGITKAEILKSAQLQLLWIYWYRKFQFNGKHRLDALGFRSEINEKRMEHASQRLNALTNRLWKLAQLADEDVQTDRNRISKLQIYANSVVGNDVSAIEHLCIAALHLGYKSDHFVRSIGVDSIRRLEGESDNEHQRRIVAVESHRLSKLVGYTDSGKQPPSLQTHALRSIWPLLDIDVPTLKQLFLTDRGVHRHGKAIRSILKMISPDLNLTTGYIDKFLLTQN